MIDANSITAKLLELGVPRIEAAQMTDRMVRVHGPEMSVYTFIFECIKHLMEENKELKDEIACMKRESNSSN